MKTAKEWAESVVRACDVDVALEDSGGHVRIAIEFPVYEVHEAAVGIIERLVERVQADARVPLEEEIARLRAENVRLNAEHVEYRAFIADANDMLAEEHEQARRLGE